MTDNQERKLDKFGRVSVFMSDNTTDFPLNSPGDRTRKELGALVSEIQALAAEQISGMDDKAQAFANLERDRDALDDDLEKINLAARAMADEAAGIENKFRLPRKPSDATLLATARSFLADAVPHEAMFVEYGLAADFLADLQADINAFEQSSAAADSATEAHSGATGALAAAFRQGIKLSGKLNSIVKIKYRDNAGKLASWTVASHLERAARKPKPAPTT